MTPELIPDTIVSSILQATNLVRVNADGIKVAAHYVRLLALIWCTSVEFWTAKIPLYSSNRFNDRQIRRKLEQDSYTPRTWRTHPLHMCPPEPYDPTDPLTKTTLDWVFLISSLNFSFWSPFEGTNQRYGIEWYASWEEAQKTDGRRQVFTGYWSLVASLDRGYFP